MKSRGYVVDVTDLARAKYLPGADAVALAALAMSRSASAALSREPRILDALCLCQLAAQRCAS